MSWPLSILCGLLGAAAGAAMAGYIADRCVEWYRVSSFEGKAGYFVILIGLVGLVAGGIIGIVCARSMTGGFVRVAGLGLGIVAAVGLATYGLARAFGDVPPTVRGDEVDLLIEVRCPPEWKLTNRVKANRNSVTLSSITEAGWQRSTMSGELLWEEARTEDGRHILPGRVFLFTTTGKRGLDISLGGDEPLRFLVPLPGSPGPEYLNWSEWLPRSTAEPDPVRGFRYRFRLRSRKEILREEQDREQAAVEARKRAFENLKDDSPLAEWLVVLDARHTVEPWLIADGTIDRASAVIRARSGELAPALTSGDEATVRRALRSLNVLNEIPDSLVEPLRQVAAGIAVSIRRHRETYDANDPDPQSGLQIKNRFFEWREAWERIAERRGVWAKDELKKMVEEAEGDPDGEIQALRSTAQRDLERQ